MIRKRRAIGCRDREIEEILAYIDTKDRRIARNCYSAADARTQDCGCLLNYDGGIRDAVEYNNRYSRWLPMTFLTYSRVSW